MYPICKVACCVERSCFDKHAFHCCHLTCPEDRYSSHPISPPSPFHWNTCTHHSQSEQLFIECRYYNPILPDTATMDTIRSSIHVALRSSTTTYLGSASYQTSTGAFTAAVVPASRGRYTLSVEYNNVTVGALVHMGVAPDVRDIGIYCTCWWYSLCNFQYRQHYENTCS